MMNQRTRTRCSALLAALVLSACGGDASTVDGGDATTGGTPTQTLTYMPDDTTDFLNPERGWMDRGGADVFARARAGDGNHEAGYSVVWTPVGDPFDNGTGNPFRLDNYRAQDLPAALLDAVRDTFADARTAGIKLKVRFTYNYSGGEDDTTREWMLRHIEQLGLVLTENADTIASLDTGFIGAWGEMHSSTLLVDSDNPDWQEPWVSARLDIIHAVLAATPSWLNVGVRYPRFVRQLFGEPGVDGPGYRMDLGSRFSGTEQSRLGWYNDCLWSNRGNTGTYSTGNDVDFALDRDTFETVGRFAATSGESCDVGDGLSESNTCEAVLADMELLNGPDTLFRGYWEGMYDRWIEDGCYDEVSRRMGYRLQLVSATLPTVVQAGEPMTVQLALRNTGFGKVYNPRPVELVLVGEAGTFTVRLSDDARRDLPLAGESITASFETGVTDSLPAGEYAVHLRLPDASTRLASDVRYSLRLANAGGIWDADTGRHGLGATIEVRR